MASPCEQVTDHLIGSIYSAVTAPQGFQSFAVNLAEAFRLKAVTIIIRHAETQEVRGLWLHGISEQWVERYALEYGPEDLLGQFIMAAPIAAFYASNLDLPHPERFYENRFYREWVAPQGVAYAAGGIILREGGWMTQIIVQRAATQAPFVRAELALLDRLVPHLQRAIQMRQRFAELQLGQHMLSGGGLDLLAMPAFLFNEDGKVAQVNRSAQRWLPDERHLWLDEGHLSTPDPLVNRRISLELSKALRVCRGEGSYLNGVVLLPRSARTALMLMIVLLPFSSGRYATVLFAFDPELAPAVTADMVRRLFGLSEAEAQLAIALCAGKTLDDAATERGTSVHTTRSQLKSIFGKTGAKRQADLVSLLLTSPAYFLAQARSGD